MTTEERMEAMIFSSVYPLYVQKVERKGRTEEELRQVLCWLTGYDEEGLSLQIQKRPTMVEFFAQAPQFNPKAELISGTICGVKIGEISHALSRKVRQMDKLVDELAKGKALQKVMRE